MLPLDYWFGGGVFLFLSSASCGTIRGGPASAPSADRAESDRRPTVGTEEMRDNDPYDFHD
jgi:hypothetical protein